MQPMVVEAKWSSSGHAAITSPQQDKKPQSILKLLWQPLAGAVRKQSIVIGHTGHMWP